LTPDGADWKLQFIIPRSPPCSTAPLPRR
jgi:hypothetical protein